MVELRKVLMRGRVLMSLGDLKYVGVCLKSVAECGKRFLIGKLTQIDIDFKCQQTSQPSLPVKVHPTL